MDRAEREARAKHRASTLPKGEYYAYDNWLYDRDAGPVIECESHWDACLVMIAYAKGEENATHN